MQGNSQKASTNAFEKPKESQDINQLPHEKSIESDQHSQSNDSIIITDDEQENFTTQMVNMKGASYPEKVEDYIASTLLTAPNHGVQITNLAAAKTAFIVKEDFQNFEYKKENLLKLMKQSGGKDGKAPTKGKFNDHLA